MEGGIDYFKCDADVNVSVVAQKLFDGENGGAEFWEEKELRSDCHRVLRTLVLSLRGVLSFHIVGMLVPKLE